MSALKHLFEPIMVGKMVVKNRLVMPPMGVNFGVDDEGYVTEQLCEYFSERAKGGTGMMIMGGGATHPTGLDLPVLPLLWDDKYIPALKKLADAAHEDGSKFGMQLLHGGRQVWHDNRVAPSPIKALAAVTGDPPRELDIDTINEILESFGTAARRCREAGIDFVEIHAAHGYLVNQFMAQNSNIRTDQYGGSFENRIRFFLECIQTIQSHTGGDFPIGVRFNGDDFVHNGWTLEESVKLAPILEKHGACYLHISASVYGSFPITIPSMYAEEGCFVHLAEAVKKEVSIPVITVGRIKNPIMADRIIKEGRADMVSMGRAHLADSELAKKAASGKHRDIRPCLGCCLGCVHSLFLGGCASCVMNPKVSREYLFNKQPPVADTVKNLLVVGAGPAGLAFARRAAKRGHRVTICEEQCRLGGMLQTEAIPPRRGELLELVYYFEKELKKLEVPIRLNTPLSEKLLDELQPDEVIIATGSLPEIPLKFFSAKTDMGVHTYVDILEQDVIVGDRVLVIGGDQLGLETADLISDEGKEVVVLHSGAHYAEGMPNNDRTYLRERLKKPNVQLNKNIKIKEILTNGIVCVQNGETHTFEDFNDIVISEGLQSYKKPMELLKGTSAKVHVIGDAKKPMNLADTQSEADALGREI